jgi:hypothetical protein
VIGGEPKAEYVLRDVYDWGAEARTGSDRERPAVIVTEIGEQRSGPVARDAPLANFRSG